MFRATVPRLVSKAIRARPTPPPATVPQERRPATVVPATAASLIDPPLVIPGYDFLGRPLDEGIAKEVTKSASEQILDALPETQIQSTAKTKTQLLWKPTWLSSLPKKLQPQAGTTFYEIYMDASPTTTKAGFWQRLMYGVPESVLDSQMMARATEKLENSVKIRATEEKVINSLKQTATSACESVTASNAIMKAQTVKSGVKEKVDNKTDEVKNMLHWAL